MTTKIYPTEKPVKQHKCGKNGWKVCEDINSTYFFSYTKNMSNLSSTKL